MAAPSSTSQLNVSYTPGCPNLLHKQTCLISSHLPIPELLRVSFAMTSALRIVPANIVCGIVVVSAPPLQQPVCVCQVHSVSAVFLRSVPHWSHSTKKDPVFPCFAGTINVPWTSQAPLLSFSLAVIFALFPFSCALSPRFLLFIGWCRSRTTNQFQSLSQ